jgi:hypothetical protein
MEACQAVRVKSGMYEICVCVGVCVCLGGGDVKQYPLYNIISCDMTLVVVMRYLVRL